MTPDPADDDADRSGERRLQPTPPGPLAVCAGVGLVGGWLLHPVAERLGGTAPLVTWLQPIALFLVAAVVGGTAWATWRTVQVRHERLEAHRAVNRFVLARSCALVAALVAGGYAGYAVSWLGVDAALASQRIVRSLVAALAAVLVLVAGLVLESACRVRPDNDPST